jgi:hypothetical protein
MKNSSLHRLFVACLLLAACSGLQDIPPTHAPPVVDTPTISATAEDRSDSEATQEYSQNISKDWRCSHEPRISTLTEDVAIHGEILLWLQDEEDWSRNYVVASESPPIFTDLSIGDQFHQNLRFISFGSSPNSQKHGFIPLIEDYDRLTGYSLSDWKVAIYSNDNLEISNIDVSEYLDSSERGFPLSDWSFSQWVSEDLVMVTFIYYNPEDWKYHDEVNTVLDLSTLSWREELINVIPGTLPSDGKVVSISPDLSRMLFGSKGSLSLYNRDTFELIQDSIPFASSRQIRWQGAQYFVTYGFGNRTPAVVDRFGNLYFEEFAQNRFGFTTIDDIQWAPNHPWLGIIGTIKGEDDVREKHFKVYDVLHQAEIYSCLLIASGNPIKPNFFYWSPDSEEIVYSAYIDFEQTYILDLSLGETYQLSESAVVRGWSPFSFDSFE